VPWAWRAPGKKKERRGLDVQERKRGRAVRFAFSFPYERKGGKGGERKNPLVTEEKGKRPPHLFAFSDAEK